MKRLLLVLVLLMTAGSLFAAELKVTGDMYVRGSTYSNLDLAEEDEAMFSMFDYDLTVNAAFIANEKATVFTRFAFDKNVAGSGYVADSSADAGDVGLALERAYINYKFAPFLQVNTGLMGGGQWASTFGDTEKNVMRVQAIGALSKEMVFIATYEKRDENGSLGLKDAENDDETFYYLASRMIFGPVTVMPLLVYGQKGISKDTIVANLDTSAQWETAYIAALAGGATPAVAESTADSVVAGAIAAQLGALAKDDYTVITKAFQLGLNGDFGMVGFESEFHYVMVDVDEFELANGGNDVATYGAYINVFAKVDALKAGLIFAYGSADEEDGAFNFGDDFDLFLVIDDFIANTDAAGLTGFTAYKLYAEYTMDKITAMAAFGYGYSNMKDNDGEFMEFDLGAAYAIDANTTYSVAFGYAKTSDFLEADVDADAWRLYHKLSVKF